MDLVILQKDSAKLVRLSQDYVVKQPDNHQITLITVVQMSQINPLNQLKTVVTDPVMMETSLSAQTMIE